MSNISWSKGQPDKDVGEVHKAVDKIKEYSRWDVESRWDIVLE